MSPRRTILRELNRLHDGGNGGYTRPGTITGFSQNPTRYQEAVNALLQERLINGTKDAEGRLAIALNGDRMQDVRKELRPLGARPATWLAILIVAAAGFAGWVLLA